MELKKIRMQKGVTQKTVADSIQCSPTVYARYERGEREPSIETLLRLSAYFDVTVDYLLGNQKTAIPDFTEYEIELLAAARGADERAKEDALEMLLAHQVARGGDKVTAGMNVQARAVSKN